ncbi:chitin deacetylase [Coprinopsis cinerea okayama7|uniref:chitin deacetylase n=1 Tax=Coprinopsis cinerea (strain Okayama-7 / 130 / ATCC MYA-4618 / FGSC 9003) TaxID=240176 RepID=D6RMB6_COPC7|nr:chitin deacetylase [Coprinopsis cinerea okayama7\|eukprot:XP_002911435.1 chitin deacetylase [Coprinopsis cinerea okayama7\
MKSVGVVALLSLSALAADVHGEHARRDAHMLHARQDLPTPSGSDSSGAPSGTSRPVGSEPATDSWSFSLRATNPTAVPLESITAGVATRATMPLESTAVPGAVPTAVQGAPELPDISAWDPRQYPDLDAIPPVDSPEVQQWIDEVKNSGIEIPGYEPTAKGAGCQDPANLPFTNDASRCWWTCGGCTTVDDISECTEKNHWGLTFDDGPGFYTPNLLQYLDEVNLKATFFVVGSRVVSFPHTLQTQYTGGHQIAVHTWSHKALTTLTNEEIIAELGWTKKVIRDVLGVTPSHMRPPFGDIDNRVRAISHAMGLTPVMWTRTPDNLVFNTEDFDINGGTATVEKVLHNWQNILQSVTTLDKGFIVLQHDLFQQAIDVATGYILPDGLAHQPQFTIEPVITCVNMPNANAYIETNDNSTNPFKAQLGKSSPGRSAATGLTAGVAGALAAGGAGFAVGLLSMLGF